jgi:hypothetical protein
MTRNHITAGAFVIAAVLSIAVVPRSFGQAAATPTTTTTTQTTVTQVQPTTAPVAAPETNEEVVELSPFVVDATQDTGYEAHTTLAGTRVRSDLKDIASSISVVTQQFLQDTGAVNNEDLLVYTPSTEVSGVRGNFSGVAGSPYYNENTVNPATRVRGLDAADNTRDYFLTDIPWDSYNVGRVDLQRGPNSILFGTGSPAGIINTSTDDAAFKTTYNVTNRLDGYGSVRDSFNFNKVLIDNVLAIRVAWLQDNERFEQNFAYNNQTRYYGALRFDPKLFGEGNHTSIRVNFEKGSVTSNNPRDIPPVDEITPWFQSGTNAYGEPGLNHLIINQYSQTNANPSGTPLPGGSGGVLASSTYELGGWAETRSYWPDTLNYYEDTQQIRNNIPNANPPSGTPIKAIAAEANTGLAITGPGISSGIGGLLSGFRPYGLVPFSLYAGFIGEGGGGTPDSAPSFVYPVKPIPGGPYYNDVVIQDPTIYNMYTNLLDGPNKQEWQHWSALSFAIDQSFFNDRLSFELAADHQDYSEGQNQWLSGENYAITVDVNGSYSDGTTNKNAGRPYVGNSASSPSLNTGFATNRNVLRFTPTYELRGTDLFGDTTLAKIFGKQNFTLLWDDDQVITNNISWAEYATTPAYWTDNNPAGTGVATLGSNREFDWLAYLGPNMSALSTASGANLNGLDMIIAPPKTQNIWNFNSTWNATGIPGQNTQPYVNPLAPFTYLNNTGNLKTAQQANNPANYVGWSYEAITWMDASNPTDFPSLVESSGRINYRDISTGATWQGHFLDGDLVPVFGIRKDVITNFNTSGVTDTTSGFTSANYPDNQTTRSDVRGQSKSWGGVYHFPKVIMSKLPGDMTFSVLMDVSDNFKTDAQRMNLAGAPIPNATGTTREYGFVITALNEKLSLKVDWFNTKVSDATLDTTSGNSIGGLGSNGYFLADGTIWGYSWAASLQDYLDGLTPNSGYGDYATADGFSRGTAAQNAAANNYDLNGGIAPNGFNYCGGNAVVNAWLAKGPDPIPLANFPNFFNSFNLTPTINPSLGIASGQLRNGFVNGYADSGGPVTGGGSTFGDHVTTVSNLSKGVELELTAQPLKNWNITLNYVKVKATHEDIDPVSEAFIGQFTQFMNGPGGQVRMWGNGPGSALGSDWNESIVPGYVVLQNSLGHEAPEVSPWRINLVTTYTFDHGLIKGAFIGAGLRSEDGRIIGYKYNPNFVNAIATNPYYATNLVPGISALTTGGLDVSQPFRGPTDTHVDAWIGYSRKVTKDINWRIQLNIQSVGEKDKLVAAQDNPDGTVALVRIQEGMGFRLTNAFDF